MGMWIFGAAMAVIGLLGLFMASFATDTAFANTGFVFFAFAFCVIFWMIRRATEPKHD